MQSSSPLHLRPVALFQAARLSPPKASQLLTFLGKASGSNCVSDEQQASDAVWATIKSAQAKTPPLTRVLIAFIVAVHQKRAPIAQSNHGPPKLIYKSTKSSSSATKLNHSATNQNMPVDKRNNNDGQRTVLPNESCLILMSVLFVIKKRRPFSIC